MEEKHPRIGVGVIIKKEGKCLLGKRRNAHGEGYWAFPGGHLEFGESVETCARREVSEETGMELGNISLVRYTEDVFKEEGRHYVTLFVLADWKSEAPQLLEPHKCEGWQWFAWNELPSPLFLPISNLIAGGYDPFPVPALTFHVVPPKSHYLWIKDNPKYAGWAAYSLEEIAGAVAEGAKLVRQAIAGKERQILKDIATLTGYEWKQSELAIYPTFLGPSWSFPLSLKTARLAEGVLGPEDTDKTVGVLIHELAHNCAPPEVFPDRETSEQATDLVALEVMRRNGIDTRSYSEFTDRITADQASYVPGSITPEELFSPTVREYLARL